MTTKDLKLKAPEELVGSTFGKYQLREKLGSGGKGIVFKVWDTLEGRAKAVKVIPPQVADSPLAFKELNKELKNASDITHPNVVKVLGMEEQDGQYFIVMEFIEGRSLEEILAENKDKKLKEKDVLKIMKQVAEGLNEAHRKKVIHRDIKPANIMLTPQGEVKILDFSISYQITTTMVQNDQLELTSGTQLYMAPEQHSTSFGRQDEQVDVWGFGITMYQLLTGELPFWNKELITNPGEKPFEPEGVSKKTRDIVMKCLEKDRKKRFKNMEEVLKALKAEAKVKRKKPPKQMWILLAALTLVLFTFAVILKNQLGNKEPVNKQDGVTITDPTTRGKNREPADKKDPLTKEKQAAEEKIKKLKEKTAGLKAVKSRARRVYKNKKGFLQADFGEGIFLVYIPASTFIKGTKPGVYLEGYWMGKTEVTVKQYMKFAYETGYHYPEWLQRWSKYNIKTGYNNLYRKLGSALTGDIYPIVGISRHDANAYCDWLSKKKGITFKLPTEAQWEKAARGTGGRKYPWGNHPAHYKGRWYANYAAYGSWDRRGEDGFLYTSPVGAYPRGASPYGLLDMAGNVWEWCGSGRAMRGGGWHSNDRNIRCTSRNRLRSSHRSSSLGFRLCMAI